MRKMRNQIFHSPGNEEAELAKIPGNGDPPPPHWDGPCFLYIKFSWIGVNGESTKNYFPVFL